jgi:mannose-6-phosphate isomerase class I
MPRCIESNGWRETAIHCSGTEIYDASVKIYRGGATKIYDDDGAVRRYLKCTSRQPIGLNAGIRYQGARTTCMRVSAASFRFTIKKIFVKYFCGMYTRYLFYLI